MAKSKNIVSRHLSIDFQGDVREGFGLKDQINRSTGSVMDNVAEGFERSSKNEFINMLSYAKGSSGEVLSQLYRALDREHISDKILIT